MLDFPTFSAVRGWVFENILFTHPCFSSQKQSPPYPLLFSYPLSLIKTCTPLPCENLHYPISTCTHHPAAIMAPCHGAHAFAAHQPMTCDLLRTRALL